MTMADPQIVVMDPRRIEQIFGTPQRRSISPRNSLMVARFVGSPSMNLMEARLAARPARHPARTPGRPGRPRMPRAGFRSGCAGRPCSLPETLDAPESPAEASFRVELIELLGARGIVTLRSGDLSFKAVLDERHLRVLSPQCDLGSPYRSIGPVFTRDGRRVRSNG